MINLLKDMIRPLYWYLTKRDKRAFSALLDKRNYYKRNSIVRDVRFLDYTIDVVDYPSFTEQFKDIFVDESYKFTTGSSTPVIIDYGANIGISCLYFKAAYPGAKIIAFEADENIAKMLANNLKNNNIDDVEIIRSAVWIHSNGVDFLSDGADGGSIKGTGAVSVVSSIRLLDFIKKIGKVDLLKIDIEGAEYEVIKDCRRELDDVKNIFIEYHSWNNSSQRLSEILKILEENSYRYYIDGVCGRQSPFVNQGDDKNMDLQLNIYCTRRDSNESSSS